MPRTVYQTAELMLGWEYWLAFASAAKVLNRDQEKEIRTRVWRALLDAADRQAEFQSQSSPGELFVRMLAAVLSSAQAYVVAKDGSAPTNPQNWGWRRNPAGNWEPGKVRIGWLDPEHLYLQPDAAFAACQEVARTAGGGQGWTFRPETVWREFHERGMLARSDIDSKRKTFTALLRLPDKSRPSVLHLSRAGLPLMFCADPPDPEGLTDDVTGV